MTISNYVKIFVDHNGPPPYPCQFCDKQVLELGRRGFVHHKDEDRHNNDPANLAAAHVKCHTLHHVSGKPGPNLGKPKTPEIKAKISASLKGRKLSDETRAKMSAARQRDREKIRQKSLDAWAEGRGRNQHTG